MKYILIFLLSIFTSISPNRLMAQIDSTFHILAFYTAENDQAHISFVHEANQWFAQESTKHHFTYTSTNNWDNLNSTFIHDFDLIIFLDTRPEETNQRLAFEEYMNNGGAWIGFHFAAFALTPSSYPNNWNWYHDEFLGSGEYKSNTWRPTSATLKIEDKNHPIAKGLVESIQSSPNEWYSWEKDLRLNPDIDILLSIDPKSFPLGTGPKKHEIWHEGYYPVVWTNNHYKMVYFNMGHNDIDYENGTNNTLSFSFNNKDQTSLVLNAIHWLFFGK